MSDKDSEVKFESKVDAWIAIVILGSFAITFVMAIWFAGIYPVLSLTMIPLLAIEMWMFLNTCYVFAGKTMMAYCGPMRFTVKIEDIQSVEPSFSALSGPALSMERLKILHGNPDRPKCILVSPKEQEKFLKHLASLDKKLKLTDRKISRKS